MIQLEEKKKMDSSKEYAEIISNCGNFQFWTTCKHEKFKLSFTTWIASVLKYACLKIEWKKISALIFYIWNTFELFDSCLKYDRFKSIFHWNVLQMAMIQWFYDEFSLMLLSFLFFFSTEKTSMICPYSTA